MGSSRRAEAGEATLADPSVVVAGEEEEDTAATPLAYRSKAGEGTVEDRVVTGPRAEETARGRARRVRKAREEGTVDVAGSRERVAVPLMETDAAGEEAADEVRDADVVRLSPFRDCLSRVGLTIDFPSIGGERRGSSNGGPSPNAASPAPSTPVEAASKW